jgi:hypothetical protein
MITLFSERPEPGRRPYSVLGSILAHGATFGLVYLGLVSEPKVKPPALAQKYDVRHIDLHTLEPRMQRAANSGIEQLRSHSVKQKLPPGENTTAQPQVMRQVVLAPQGPQTLLQPDIPKPVTLTQEIPVPTVVIWDGKKSSAKKLVPPLPEKPAVADVQPSTQLPNEEQKLDNIALASTDSTAAQQPFFPSTTSPLVVHGPEPAPPTPVTTAEGSAQPTPAAVMSLSDLHMENGDVTLPPVNESATSNSSGALAAGQAQGSAQAGQVKPASKPGEMGAGQGSSDAGESTESGSAAPGDEPASRQTGAPQTGIGSGNQHSAAHISLPKDGQFGAVVVGSSMEERYPETAPLWSGRLSYTVYLHVGLAKSWILQYSLSRADNAAAAGNITHIDAPWPYNIVRPNIPPGAIDADALMVHGFVNQAGRFETLSVLFPPQFAQAKFVLDALAQWQFRPAAQNGQNVLVEVLLIIPDEPQ